MLMLKTKFAKFVMGLMVVSVMSLGAVSPVNATEIQSDLDNNANATTQGEVQEESSQREHAAAQFTYNEDGDKILTVTPKSDFRSHNANFHNGEAENPVVVDEETPVVNEETPAVVDEETPVVDEETPAVVDEETPVVDEETPVVVDEETPVVDEETPAVVDEETPVVVDEETPVVVDEETPVVDEETPVVVDEETPVEITKISVYAQLVNSYDKLLDLYETLLNNFALGTSI
jgi:hypothetical protein